MWNGKGRDVCDDGVDPIMDDLVVDMMEEKVLGISFDSILEVKYQCFVEMDIEQKGLAAIEKIQELNQ